MGIAQDLQAKTLELRKQRSDIAPGFQSVMGFAQSFAKERGLKGGDATINDEDSLRAIQRGIKMCRDTIEALGDASHVGLDAKERTRRELAALEDLLPQMASESDVREAVELFLLSNSELIGDKKAMGAVMQHLNAKFGTSLDKAIASSVAKDALNRANA